MSIGVGLAIIICVAIVIFACLGICILGTVCCHWCDCFRKNQKVNPNQPGVQLAQTDQTAVTVTDTTQSKDDLGIQGTGSLSNTF